MLKQGLSRSLAVSKEALASFLLFVQRKLNFLPHISPGKLDSLADALSRNSASPRELEFYPRKNQCWDAFPGLQMGLSVSLRYTTLEAFISHLSHPEMEAVVAQSLEWNRWFFYLFPLP